MTLLVAVVGTSVGIGLFTFLYAKGGSYLTDRPEACTNCHIMNNQYNAWMKSGHRLVAVCNDCHAPEAVVEKYATKLSNGFRHSLAFTTGHFHEPIRITRRNRKIAEASCRKCHQTMVESIEGHREQEAVSCLRCHATVGHAF